MQGIRVITLNVSSCALLHLVRAKFIEHCELQVCLNFFFFLILSVVKTFECEPVIVEVL